MVKTTSNIKFKLYWTEFTEYTLMGKQYQDSRII